MSRSQYTAQFAPLAAAFALSLAAALPALSQATPPGVINYQGVLRDSSDEPLDGSFDMVFRFWSAETGGDEILLDRHLAAIGQAVTVSGGLFSVVLGTGGLLDGSGPGTYTSLADVFRDYGDVWLEVQVGAETLSPRIRVAAAGYALNASHLEGHAAGHFLDASPEAQTKSGQLTLDASGGYGIVGKGTSGGGYFEDKDESSVVYAGYGRDGIHAAGMDMAGSFENLVDHTLVRLAYVTTGIYAAAPQVGGWFFGNTSEARVADFYYGITASGPEAGGYFATSDKSASATVAEFGQGIRAYGYNEGGYFEDTDSSASASVAYSTYKIYGTGSVAFVQNHPEDSSKVVVYNAPEASEVAVYTRGSARLAGGQATVALDPTFAWVANPDLGLTAHLTPRGRPCLLYAVSTSTSELNVRSDDPDCADAAFDYMVWGLRIGFEEATPVQLKTQEAPIPSMEDHRQLAAKHPELARYTALERFKAMAQQVTPGAKVDLSRAQALVAAIHEFDPATDPLPAPADSPDREPPAGPPAPPAAPGPSEAEPGATPTALPPGAAALVKAPVAVSAVPASEALPSAVALPPGAAWFPLVGEAEPGDLLAIDPDDPSRLHRTAQAGDPNVVGVAAGTARPRRDGSEGFEIPVLGSGFAQLKVDAGFGAIRPGDLLVASPTTGHAMRAVEIVPGTVVAKALQPLDSGMKTIRVLILPQ